MDQEAKNGHIIRRDHTDINVFTGISAERATEAEEAVLRAPVPSEHLDVLPTGEVYLPQVHYRRILNNAFGPMAWALRPMSAVLVQDNLLCREFALVVRGRFVACAIGECAFEPTNSRMNYATAAETVKSNALVRACKDLGIASECWDRSFCDRFRREFCEQYRDERTGKPAWRRKRNSAR